MRALASSLSYLLLIVAMPAAQTARDDTLEIDVEGGDAHNPPERFIANLEEGTPQTDGRTVHMGAANWIHASARRDGSFTVTNSRNGFSRTYNSR